MRRERGYLAAADEIRTKRTRSACEGHNEERAGIAKFCDEIEIHSSDDCDQTRATASDELTVDSLAIEARLDSAAGSRQRLQLLHWQN